MHFLNILENAFKILHVIHLDCVMEFSRDFQMVLAEKSVNFFRNIENVLQVSVIHFCQALFFNKINGIFFFGSFTKLLMKPINFWVQVFHYYMQSKICCGYNLLNSRIFCHDCRTW